MECDNAELSHFFSCWLRFLSLCHIPKSFSAPSKELVTADGTNCCFRKLETFSHCGKKVLTRTCKIAKCTYVSVRYIVLFIR